MITLLSKIFIKDRHNYQDVTVRRKYGVLCSIVGIVLNIILFATKFTIGLLAGAVSILADSYNNLSDAGSSLLSLFGFKFAGKKPTDENPFGHGRIEYIAGLGIAILIIVVGVNTFRDALTSLIENTQPNLDAYSNLLTIIILAVTVIVKIYMVIYNTSVGKKIDSASMVAVGSESIMDVISTAIVVGCAMLYKFTGINLDGWCGLIVSAFIIFVGIKSAKDTVGDLLGKRPDKEFVEQIYSIVLRHDDILGVHDLVVHDYGPGRKMISLHAEVSGEEDVYKLHDIIDNIMADLDRELECVSVIHMDPICTNDERVTKMRIQTALAVKKLDPRVTIHDFRMVEGPTHTNFIFDAVVPHDLTISDKEANEALCNIIKETFPNTFAVIHVDKSYI